jgi:hypothetical protein
VLLRAVFRFTTLPIAFCERRRKKALAIIFMTAPVIKIKPTVLKMIVPMYVFILIYDRTVSANNKSSTKTAAKKR